jgi:hypothetical protein
LLDTFKPQTILLEDNPLQSIRKTQYTDAQTGIIYPDEHDLTLSVSGKTLDQYIKEAIELNETIFEVNRKDGLVSTKFADGINEPSDMASYGLYHAERYRKTNSIDDTIKMTFNDLTSDEMAASFIQHCSPENRDQLIQEIKYGSLLEITAWLAFNYKQGCIKCAPFLAR